MNPKDKPVLIITHNGVEITYNESQDHWEFLLRGRQRNAQSLAKAKEAIDKEPVEARKKMEPIKIFMNEGYGSRPRLTRGLLTSFDRQYGTPAAWITINGKRSKERLERLFLDTPENAAMIMKIFEVQKQIEALETVTHDMYKTLTKPEEPK